MYRLTMRHGMWTKCDLIGTKSMNHELFIVGREKGLVKALSQYLRSSRRKIAKFAPKNILYRVTVVLR